MSNETVDVKLTPELKKKLKGFLGFTTTSEFKYVPRIFREKNEDGEYIIPKELWPVFNLKGKTGIEIADEEDNSGYLDPDSNKIHLTAGKRRLGVLEKNILGWKNFRDEEGNLIEYKRVGGVIYKTALQRIPAPLQLELHEAINEQSRLSEEELRGLES